MDMKTFGVERGFTRKLFPYLYNIARLHKIGGWDGTWPEDAPAFPNGLVIPDSDRQAYGRMVSVIWMAAFSPLKEYFESLSFEETGITVNNATTFGEEMLFMKTTPLALAKAMETKISLIADPRVPRWLIYNRAAAEQFHAATCSGEMLRIGTATRIGTLRPRFGRRRRTATPWPSVGNRIKAIEGE